MDERQSAADLSRNDILDRLLVSAELATESQQYSAAIKAYEMIGKESHRMFTSRTESLNVNVSAMSRPQLNQFIESRYGDKAKALITWLNSHGGQLTQGNGELSPRVIDSKPSVIDTKNHAQRDINPGSNPVPIGVAEPTQAPGPRLVYDSDED
jgi:hypothetical protein